MSKTSILAVRIDPEIKERAEQLYASFGLNLSDAVSMFIHQSLLVKGLPFELKNPFYEGSMNIDTGSFVEKQKDISIDELRRLIAPVAEEYDLKSLYLVGSRARGDNRPDSDYDFCYELKEPSLMTAAGLMDYLSKSINKEIDMVDRSTCSEKMLEEMKKDGVMIYEE